MSKGMPDATSTTTNGPLVDSLLEATATINNLPPSDAPQSVADLGELGGYAEEMALYIQKIGNLIRTDLENFLRENAATADHIRAVAKTHHEEYLAKQKTLKEAGDLSTKILDLVKCMLPRKDTH